SQKLALLPDVSPAILVTLMDRHVRDEAYHAALQHPRLPARYVAPAVASNRWEDRRDIARSSPHLTFAQCEQLAHDPIDIVRQTLALNPHVPPPILAILAEDPDWKVRANVAVNRGTPASLIGLLSLDPHSHVAADAVSNPHITSADLALSFSRSGGPPQGLGAHPRVPAAILAHLARHGNHAQRCEVARNPSTTADLLEELAQQRKQHDVSPHDWRAQQRIAQRALEQRRSMHIALANNPRLPPSLIRYLVDLHDWAVSHALAHHPALTPELLATLIYDTATLEYGGHLPAQAALLSNPLTPTEALGDCLFWADDHGNFRYAPLWLDVLAHANTPADMPDRLIQRGDVITQIPNREMLLGFMPLAPALFERYGHSPEWGKRYAVAHNP
ncbi:MAG TPA: hypothetical protein VKB76_05015, partial [Ktedonobacterales bacterium]|nr:hypothetical protein [Ktedonobacterales bacterium]